MDGAPRLRREAGGKLLEKLREGSRILVRGEMGDVEEVMGKPGAVMMVRLIDVMALGKRIANWLNV